MKFVLACNFWNFRVCINDKLTFFDVLKTDTALYCRINFPSANVFSFLYWFLFVTIVWDADVCSVISKIKRRSIRYIEILEKCKWVRYYSRWKVYLIHNIKYCRGRNRLLQEWVIIKVWGLIFNFKASKVNQTRKIWDVDIHRIFYIAEYVQVLHAKTI